MTRDDRILPATRWLLMPLGILATTFGLILFFLPDRTDTLFAWTIVPQMSAVFIGASYIFGAISIWHLLLNGRWHPMRVALPGTLAFGTAMLAATLLHLDRFHHGSLHIADFDFSRPMTIAWFVGVAGALLGTVGYYVWNERLSRARPAATSVEA